MTLSGTDPLAVSLSRLDPPTVYALAVGTVMFVIALAHWLASHRADRLALRLFALHYAAAGFGWYFGHPRAHADDGPAPFVPMVVAVVLLAVLVIALGEFVGRASRRRTATVVAAALAVVTALWAYRRVDAGSPLAIYAVMAVTMVGCSVTAWRARRREPGVGHGAVAAGFAAFPLALAAPLAFGVRPADLNAGYWVALPTIVVGATVLVVSLKRTARRVDDELRRRAQVEQALRELAASLEQRVADRTSELRLIAHGLEAFTRNVSHDLRGSLSGLAGLVRLAEQAVADGDAGRARQLLAPVAPQLDHLLALVRQLLEVSRLDDVELRRRLEPGERLVQQALDQLGLAPDSAALLDRVTVQVDPLPMLDGDPTLLRQVFVNLIGNALRFAAAGSGKAWVRVGAREVDGASAIVVEDNGPGFDADRAASLFAPFTRLHDASLSQHGIGLSIVQRIVEHHGGRVGAEGTPGRGATFWFTLPGVAR